MSVRRAAPLLLALLAVLSGWASAADIVTRPFVGVTHTQRCETSPRPLVMHVVDIDLAAPNLHFRLTPHRGLLETTRQTTLQYLAEQHAQIAINAHFFEPWPPPSPDDEAADLVGIAASDGDVYSPFMENPPKQYAIRPNAPGLNIDAANHAAIVHRNPADPSGRSAAEPVVLYNTLAGNEQIVSGAAVTVQDTAWNRQLNPRTAIGLTRSQHLILFTVDGRQPGVSEGLTVAEVANLLVKDYGVVEALDLDGGGSTTLAMADPTPRVANIPVGVKDQPHTERPVGSNLAVFAQAAEPANSEPPTAIQPSGALPWTIAAATCGAIVVWLAWRRRRRSPRR